MYFDLHGVRKFIYNMKTYIKIFIRISTVDNQMIFLVQFEKKKTPESFLKDYIVYSPFINKLVSFFLFSEEEKGLHIFWKPPSKLCD